MASVAVVKAELRALLSTVNFEVTTERMIRGILSEKLGDIEVHTELIRAEIEAFLADMEEASGQARHNVESTVKRGTEPISAGTKRKAEGTNEDVDDNPAAKIAKREPSGYYLLLGENKFLTVTSWKGKRNVGIREYFEKEGQLHAGSKGTSLDASQWRVFCENMGAFEAALEEHNEDFLFKLSERRIVSVAYTRGLAMLDVREWYQAGEGEIAPTKKGVRFDLEALLCIKAHLSEISAAQEAADPATTAAASRSGGQASTSAAAAADVPQRKQADDKPAAAAGVKGQEQAGDDVDLGGKKRMRATAFKGKTYVDFREFYEKDGELMPGKKGVMLPMDQWEKLVGSLGSIQNALAAKDTAFFVELGSKRRAAVTEFKGKQYVGVREYYEKDGKMLPGMKGLNMSAEQWAIAVANVDKITKDLETCSHKSP